MRSWGSTAFVGGLALDMVDVFGGGVVIGVPKIGGTDGGMAVFFGKNGESFSVGADV